MDHFFLHFFIYILTLRKSDLAIGTIYYRSQIGLLTGWVHHTVYMVLVEIAIRRSWSHIFCLCAAMEVRFFLVQNFQHNKNFDDVGKKKKKIPTFILGFMTLYPELRSNVVFAVTFFLTRILFHIALGVSYFLQDNRIQATGGSYVPSLLLVSIFPLHAMWFYGCIKGFFRRASKQQPIPIVVDLPVDLPTKVAPQPELQTKRTTTLKALKVADRLNARSTDSTPSPQVPTRDLKVEHSKLHSRRFYSRSMSLSGNDSRTLRFRTKLYASLPNREAVFDYVGLGRGGVQEQ